MNFRRLLELAIKLAVFFHVQSTIKNVDNPDVYINIYPTRYGIRVHSPSYARILSQCHYYFNIAPSNIDPKMSGVLHDISAGMRVATAETLSSLYRLEPSINIVRDIKLMLNQIDKDIKGIEKVEGKPNTLQKLMYAYVPPIKACEGVRIEFRNVAENNKFIVVRIDGNLINLATTPATTPNRSLNWYNNGSVTYATVKRHLRHDAVSILSIAHLEDSFTASMTYHNAPFLLSDLKKSMLATVHELDNEFAMPPRPGYIRIL